MNLTEKSAYIKGLAEGLGIGNEAPTDKLIVKLRSTNYKIKMPLRHRIEGSWIYRYSFSHKSRLLYAFYR